MSKPSILVLGKRGGILQWYEGLLDAKASLTDVQIDGFALNHNNWHERILKKILKLSYQNLDHYTAKLLARKIQNTQPDIILIADLFYLSLPLLEVLQHAKPKAKIYHWIGDFFDERLKFSSPIIDQFFFTDSSFLDDARQMGIVGASFLPLATNPRIFKQTIPFHQKKPRLLFVGAYSESREKLIKTINFPMTIVGKGWENLNSHNLALKIYPRKISIHTVARLYDEHQYIFNAINKNNTRQGLTMRCFDVQACGSLLITEYSPDLEKTHLKQYYYFKNPNEINTILYQLINHPILIIQKENENNRNSYSDRIKQILEKSNHNH